MKIIFVNLFFIFLLLSSCFCYNNRNQRGVSNNAYFRGISDRLDNRMGWTGDRKEQSGVRGVIHGVYHSAVGIGKTVTGNMQGAKAEFNRAGQQFDRTSNAMKNTYEKVKRSVSL